MITGLRIGPMIFTQARIELMRIDHFFFLEIELVLRKNQNLIIKESKAFAS